MNRFIKADEVAEELGISKPYAYKIITSAQMRGSFHLYRRIFIPFD